MSMGDSNLGAAVCCDTEQNTAKCQNSYYRPSVAEESEKQANYHYEQGGKASSAAYFLKLHPEFDEFIRLIRAGSIQI